MNDQIASKCFRHGQRGAGGHDTDGAAVVAAWLTGSSSISIWYASCRRVAGKPGDGVARRQIGRGRWQIRGLDGGIIEILS